VAGAERSVPLAKPFNTRSTVSKGDVRHQKKGFPCTEDAKGELNSVHADVSQGKKVGIVLGLCAPSTDKEKAAPYGFLLTM